MNKENIQETIILGDTEVGKTQIINRFCHHEFQPNYKPTLGMNFYNKKIEINNKTINIIFYDSSGQEKFKSLIEIYNREANIIFLVYDITNKNTFININKYIEMIKEIKKEDSIIFLLRNKNDLENQRKVIKKEAEELAEKKGFLFYEISTKKIYDDINNLFQGIIIPEIKIKFNIEKIDKIENNDIIKITLNIYIYINYKSIKNKELNKIQEINNLKKELEILKNENKKLKQDLSIANKKISNIENNELKLKEENLDLKNQIYDLKSKLDNDKKEELKDDLNDIMFLNFISTNSFIYCEIKCSPNDIFAEVEEKFYKIYSNYRSTNNMFKNNSKPILRFKTLSENNIKNGDIVQLFTLETN